MTGVSFSDGKTFADLTMPESFQDKYQGPDDVPGLRDYYQRTHT